MILYHEIFKGANPFVYSGHWWGVVGLTLEALCVAVAGEQLKSASMNHSLDRRGSLLTHAYPELCSTNVLR